MLMAGGALTHDDRESLRAAACRKKKFPYEVAASSCDDFLYERENVHRVIEEACPPFEKGERQRGPSEMNERTFCRLTPTFFLYAITQD